MATTRKPTGARVQPSYVEYFQRKKTGFSIFIWSETKTGADEIDSVLKELLKEYGFPAPASRSEFSGSHFILYGSTNNFPDHLAEDVHRELVNDPPRKESTSKRRELLSRLREKIAVGTGILLVAGELFGGVAALREAYEKYLKTFSVPPPPSMIMIPTPITRVNKVVGTNLKAELEVIPLPSAFGPLIDNAEKDPHKFELVMMFVIANHFESAAPPQGSIHHFRKHGCKPKTEPSPPRGNLGTL